jgi:hypothetical protein
MITVAVAIARIILIPIPRSWIPTRGISRPREVISVLKSPAATTIVVIIKAIPRIVGIIGHIGIVRVVRIILIRIIWNIGIILVGVIRIILVILVLVWIVGHLILRIIWRRRRRCASRGRCPSGGGSSSRPAA